MTLCIVGILLTSLIALFYLKIDILIATLNYLQPFNLKNQIQNLTIASHISEIVIFIGFFGIFLYFFALIRLHGFWVGEAEAEANKYLLIFQSLLFFIINAVILILLMIYGFLITPNNILQIFSTTLLLVLTLFVSFLFHKTYWPIIVNYQRISQFNHYLLTMPKNCKIVKRIVNAFFRDNNTISTFLLILLIIYPVYGYAFNINLLFIIFTELIIFYIHFQLSAAFSIPRKVSKIVLSSGEQICGYIIYESSKGFLKILTENDEKLRIFNYQIVKIV